MGRFTFVCCMLALLSTGVAVQAPEGQQFSAEQIKKGAGIFARNCSPCHGPRMAEPGAFDLRKFPHDQKTRFVTSVTKGRNRMPPWGDLFKEDDLEALWAYVITGENPDR